ncbi:transmembrane protein 199 [Copidosoma floridanum]|uniref:transmembrane protein 199 n=1 Tax=Copidosoma floridanum TaxID=29053 RepID=UPI0006C97E15|nr:transmembrane protein 199 [Copidosoma floridanum]
MPVETIEDPYVKLKLTQKLIDFIVKNVKNEKNVPHNIKTLKNCAQNKRADCTLSLKDIKWLKTFLTEQSNGKKKVNLHELLEGVDVQLPQPKITPRNPDLEARIKKLRAQQNNRDYRAMTKSVDNTRKYLPDDSLAYQMKAINKQLIAVFTFVVTVAAGFAFGFWGIFWETEGVDLGFRLLIGIICALIIALAEIYFLAKSLSEDYDELPASQPLSKRPHQD